MGERCAFGRIKVKAELIGISAPLVISFTQNLEGDYKHLEASNELEFGGSP
jgi:hypothetical protein